MGGRTLRALTADEEILVVLHQVRRQHQGMVGVERGLQLVPLWGPAQQRGNKRIAYQRAKCM